MSEFQDNPLHRLADAASDYVKSERRGKWFTNLLKLAVAFYLVASIGLLAHSVSMKGLDDSQETHVAVVRITGPIMPQTPTSAETLMPLLQDAFSNEQSKAVFLLMNSPGGSAVQSGMIFDEIMRLKKLHPNKPVYAVAEDLCASGCYYIAAAADKIFADKASIIGSIGVRFDSFGVTGLMEKIGVENRSLAAGEHKRLMDPFAPADNEAQKHLQTHVLERTHQQFIAAVRQGRGNRLKETPDTFTGLVWIGDEAVTLGLIDGLGEAQGLARDDFQLDNLLEYAPEENWLDRFAARLGTELKTGLLSGWQGGVRF